MTVRVAIGNFGGSFLFRVAKQGYDAVTGGLSNMIIHEQMQAIVPVEQGVVTVAPNSSANAFAQVTLSKVYSYRPYIVLACDKHFTPSPLTYMARISGSDFRTLRLYNLTGVKPDAQSDIFVAAQTLTIKYAVFREVVPT